MKKIVSSIPYLVIFSVLVFADQLSKMVATAHLKNQPDIVLVRKQRSSLGYLSGTYLAVFFNYNFYSVGNYILLYKNTI